MNEFTLLHLKEVDRLSKLSFIPRSFNPSKADDKQRADRKSSLQLLAGDLINSVSDYDNDDDLINNVSDYDNNDDHLTNGVKFDVYDNNEDDHVCKEIINF